MMILTVNTHFVSLPLPPPPGPGDARALKDLSRVMILYKRTVMPYAAYCRKRRGSSDQEQVEQYAALLGQTCAESILMYREGPRA